MDFIRSSTALPYWSRRRKFLKVLAAVFVATWSETADAPEATAGPPVLRTVAITGQEAPGTEAGTTFAELRVPSINAHGKLAFWGSLSGGSVTAANRNGIWTDGSGHLELVVCDGDLAPGTGGSAPANFGLNDDFFAVANINSAGQVAFLANLTGAGVNSTNNLGVWRGKAGALEMVTRTGSRAPDTGDLTVFSLFSQPLISPDGHVTLSARLVGGDVQGTTNDIGLCSDASGTFRLIGRDGNQAAGSATGVLYDMTSISSAGIGANATGQVVFRSALRGTDVTSQNDSGIWSAAIGSSSLIAREGMHPPATPSGVAFSSFSTIPSINSLGFVAFHALLSGGGVVPTTDTGIWVIGPGHIRPVIRAGNRPPDTPPGVRFSKAGPDSGGGPIINARGEVAFHAELPIGPNEFGPDIDGLWSEGLGGLHLVALGGDRAPGTPNGVLFASGDNEFARFSMNSHGQVAFQANLVGTGPHDNRGIWAEDRSGVLRLIVRRGDLLEVFPGDFRRVVDFQFGPNTNNEDGKASWFNDRGQIAFRAEFDDGSSGVFVSAVATIPEPRTLVMLPLTICVLWSRRSMPRL